MRKGSHQTEEAKLKISNSLEGCSVWNTGLLLGPRSEEVKNKIKATHQKNGKCKLRRYELICDLCGNVFQGKTPNAKACQECLVQECQQCGDVFPVTFWEKLGSKYNGPKKYCSSECYHNAMVGVEPCNKNYVSVFCQVCGKEFEVSSSRKETVKYCSYECKYNGQSQVTGEDHPLWKGGFDLYGRMLSQNEGSFYRNRVKVLARDEFVCQYCGFKGESGYMDVHHITPVRQGGTSLEGNMITLCRKHHNWADRGRIPKELLFYAAFYNGEAQ